MKTSGEIAASALKDLQEVRKRLVASEETDDPARQYLLLSLAYGELAGVVDRVREKIAEVDPDSRLPEFVQTTCEERKGPVSDKEMVEFIRNNLL